MTPKICEFTFVFKTHSENLGATMISVRHIFHLKFYVQGEVLPKTLNFIFALSRDRHRNYLSKIHLSRFFIKNLHLNMVIAV